MNDKQPIQLVLVVVQFATSALLVVASAGAVVSSPVALPLILSGTALGLWAWLTFGLRKLTVMPGLRQDAALTTTGPYRFVRHPMYTAVLLFCGGFVVAAPVWWKVILWGVLLIDVWLKSQMEERFLSAKFQEYDAYRNRTGRFLPCV